jgi:hypothetical protein
MDRKIITVKDFKNVARNNEYFLWHFLQKEQHKSTSAMFSYFDEREGHINYIKTVIDQLDIPYYESYVEDSIDFIHELGYSYSRLWKAPLSQEIVTPSSLFNPSIFGFKKFNKVHSTLDLCYCFEGVLEVVASLNPELLLSLSVKEEDLK